MSRREEGSNVRRVLLRDQYARLAAAQGNCGLARIYEKEFADGVRQLIRRGSDAFIAPRRDVLWGSSETNAQVNKPKDIQSLLPEWYVHASPICTKCTVPMIPGLTSGHKYRLASRAKLQYDCRACGATRKIVKVPKSSMSSTRSRRKDRSEILRGNHLPQPASERDSNAKSSTSQHAATLGNHTATKPRFHQDEPEVHRKSANASSPLSKLPKEPWLSQPKQSPNQKRPPSSKTFSDREGLRALLQQQKKKQSSSSEPKSNSRLADFLDQL